MTKLMSRAVALALSLAVASLAAAPAQAGVARVASSPALSRKATGPLAVSAEARLARLDTQALAAQAATPAAAGTEHKSFFKSGKGIAVILLFVGGTVWTIASAKDKRIHSPIR